MTAAAPLLTICIPTFNRAEFLRASLAAYAANPAFDDDVEIVISDNASTDGTREVGLEFASRYPNIKYFCNETNLRDSNFCVAIDRATGRFIKLQNDNSVYTAEGLAYVKQAVRKYEASRTPLFFPNANLIARKDDEIVCNSFEEFATNASIFVTAIMSFGVWKEDWSAIQDKLKYTELLLNQDDWTYQVVERKGRAVIFTGQYCNTQDIGRRKGYNWFGVHVGNYYDILQPYVDKGLVSPAALRREKRQHLRWLEPYMVDVYIARIFPDYHFDYSGTTRTLFKYFGKDPLFYVYMLTLPAWGLYVLYKNKRRKKQL